MNQKAKKRFCLINISNILFAKFIFWPCCTVNNKRDTATYMKTSNYLYFLDSKSNRVTMYATIVILC